MSRLDRFDFLAIALFSATLGATRRAVEVILRDHFPVGRFAVEEEPLDFDAIYVGRPPPGGAHAKRAVLFEPASAPNTTGMVANLEDGWLSMCSVLAARLPGRHLLARTSVDGVHPVTDFEVWEDGESVRYVGALRDDGRWSFSTRGQPFEFEHPARYQRRRVRDRLDRVLLVSYMQTLGWDLHGDPFWTSSSNAMYVMERTVRRLAPVPVE